MSLRSQDIVVALVIALSPDEKWSFPAIAKAAGVSLSEAHAAVKRASSAGLLARFVENGAIVALRENLLELLVHGVKYMFAAERGPVTRGIPTAHCAPVLAKHITDPANIALIWPHVTGSTRGEALAPLYKTVPDIALRNAKLYDVLALVDAIRAGNARERALSVQLLERILLGSLP